MSDLVGRLRDMQTSAPKVPSCQLCGEAADEIERLQGLYDIAVADRVRMHEENAKLRAVVDAAEAYFWASNLNQYDADSLDIQTNFEQALAALEDE